MYRSLIIAGALVSMTVSAADMSGWSDKTVCRLVEQHGKAEYIDEAKNRGLGCVDEAVATSKEPVISAKSGLMIENDPNLDITKMPRSVAYNPRFWWTSESKVADFNNDGLQDAISVGVMRATNVNTDSQTTGDICGPEKAGCEGENPLPALYIQTKDNKYVDSTNLIVDNRKKPGLSLGMKLLIADYNSDDILDFYVTDTGIGSHKGYVDSYYLSQPNGTWLESSETHLSHPNYINFNHGGAVGDIDGDGDMDIVLTELKPKLTCLMNNGSGNLKKRTCGNINTFALELGDIDGDGDLDLIHGGDDYSKHNHTRAGVALNNGKGNFRNSASFNRRKNWSITPELSASDLDNDGDLDIVLSRTSLWYVGTGIQILENLGNLKFKDHGIKVLTGQPEKALKEIDYEGNEYNHVISSISFKDFNLDGKMDLYFIAHSQKTFGMGMLNEGGFNFQVLYPHKIKKLIELKGKPVEDEEFTWFK